MTSLDEETNAMNEDSGSKRDARAPRFPAYHPPRHNDVAAPLVSSPSHADLIGAIREGLRPERLDRVARNLALDVEQARALIGAVSPPVRRLARLLERWEADGLIERMEGFGSISERIGEETTRSRAPESPDGLPPTLGETVMKSVAEALSASDADDERIDGAAADRLLELERLVELSHAVFESDESARLWFGTTLKALGDERPADLLGTVRGRQRVRELLYAIEFGFAA